MEDITTAPTKPELPPDPEIIKPEIKQETLDETYKQSLIFKRNQILNNTDKYMMPDYPISAYDLIIIKDYRQKLRDFTNNDYILPEPPEFIFS